jgi:6-phosphogluconate dehydrogenase
MVHNGIEYGIMAAYAEGLSVLAAAGDGAQKRADDAETAPLTNPDQYTYNFDLGAVAELWRRGSVIPSWLLDLLAGAFVESPTLAEYNGRVSDSGEGRWTAEAAVALGVPTPVLTAALQSRFASQGRAVFAGKAESALRKQFGGHAEKPAAGES